MDADIDLHLDTASTLHHQQVEMEILSSSLDENFGTLRTSTELHFSSSAQPSVNADTSQPRHVLEQVGEVLSCSGETSDNTVFADTVEEELEEVISNTDEDCWQTKSWEGLHHNTKVDRLAKEACRLPRRGDGRPLSLLCYLNRVRSAALLPEQRRRDTERPFSVTITHYESVCRHKYKYRRRGLMCP
ncbi:uncharacterized protein LOC143024455 [Oratosquilla oratoria]|uniref:uncharacterized protein LOC143024455 n=1 Tax=Oratosquilla oratoria TaxID=337810 RepID=UPI003F763340